MSKFPQTSREDVLPSKNSFSKKSHQESFNEAMSPPNTPSMKRFERKSSINPYADYCSDSNESEPDSDDY